MLSERKRYRSNLSWNIFGVVFTFVMWVVTIAVGMLLALTLIAPYVSPIHGWVFPVLGLVAPATYIASLLIAIYWVLRWDWTFATPLILLLFIGSFHVPSFVKIPVTKSYEAENEYRGCVKLMTYNVRGFFNDSGDWSVDELADYFAERKPDILSLQEYKSSAKGVSGAMRRALPNYHSVKESTMAIYSRYPIIKWDRIFNETNSVSKGALWADLVIGHDTVRVFNNHLNTTKIREDDDKYLTSKDVVLDTMRSTRLEDIIGRFAKGAADRTIQVDMVSEAIGNSPYPVVVCGDFNDTPMSYAYNKMSRGLKDSFRECGEGYTYTFRGFNGLLRIDYILTGGGVVPRSYFVDQEAHFSDHYPVEAYIKIE